MQKISRHQKTKAFALALVVGFLSSCAGSEVSDELPDLPTSEAAFLDGSEYATPVYDDAAVFADLAAQPVEGDSWGAGSTDSPFYNPIGGESLGRVAYTLYGDRSMVSELRAKNPELGNSKALGSGQRVFFDFERIRPVATFLTKDLLDRYPAELAAKIKDAGLATDRVALAQGETLQDLSQRLYGTTRYWTEIYLLNQATISNYDRVRAGTELLVYQRPMVGGQNLLQQDPIVSDTMFDAAPLQQAAQPVMPKSTDQHNYLTTQPEVPPAPAEQSAPRAFDPIPETPTTTSEFAPMEELEQPVALDARGAGFFDNSTNVRRVVYISLILLIGALAFYFTRSSNKKSFDMLDVTTSDTSAARPKFGGKDSHKQDIG